MKNKNRDQHRSGYLQDLLIRLSDGVLQGYVPLSSLLHLPPSLPHLLPELLQPPPGSSQLPLVLLHLTLLLHLIGLQRQDLGGEDGRRSGNISKKPQSERERVSNLRVVVVIL